jgi:hypothetical protein
MKISTFSLPRTCHISEITISNFRPISPPPPLPTHDSHSHNCHVSKLPNVACVTHNLLPWHPSDEDFDHHMSSHSMGHFTIPWTSHITCTNSKPYSWQLRLLPNPSSLFPKPWILMECNSLHCCTRFKHHLNWCTSFKQWSPSLLHTNKYSILS